MSRYVIEFGPEWCDGWLTYDVNASSEEEAFAIIDRLLKEGIESCDITAVDVWDGQDDPAWDIVQGVTEMGSYR